MERTYKILKSKQALIRSMIILILISLPFTGSDCNSTGTNTTPGGNVQGNWKLTFIQGNLQDICFGETANFPSNTGGNATLTCPDSNPVTAAYTVSNNQITYTTTGVTYNISSSTGTLIFTGTFTTGNVTSTRILTYSSVTTDDKPAVTPKSSSVKNSSEK